MDRLLLSPWISLVPAEADTATARAVCDVHNTALAALAAADRERVSAVGAVVLQDPALAARQIGELVTGYGLAGAEIPASVGGRYLGDDFFLPFWEAAEDAGALVFIHPTTRGFGVPALEQYYLWNSVGNPMETAIAAAHMAMAGVLERHPAAAGAARARRRRAAGGPRAAPPGVRRPARGTGQDRLPDRTPRCAGSTTTRSPTTTTCSRTWSATPAPGRYCSARTARSTWARRPRRRGPRAVASARTRNSCSAATRRGAGQPVTMPGRPGGVRGVAAAGPRPVTEERGLEPAGGSRGAPGLTGTAGRCSALLAEHGVRHVFGVPGGQTLALYDAILDRAPDLRHVLVRDERSAAYAADGYARVTGRAGVCDATVGPGAAKLPSGLGEALGASVPVVALVSDLPARLAPHRYRSAASQALDQAALLAAGDQMAGHRAGRGHPPGPGPAGVPRGHHGGARARSRCSCRRTCSTARRPGRIGARGCPRKGCAPGQHFRFGSFPAFRPAPDPQDVAAAAAVLRRGAAARSCWPAGECCTRARARS